jgi:hypothetical protein
MLENYPPSPVESGDLLIYRTANMKNFSKSKLIAYRQCPKRLWLEIHMPEKRADSANTRASYDVGNEVGRIAQQLYDTSGTGEVLDNQRDGYDFVLQRTMELIKQPKPIFEAGFSVAGVIAFADVLLPVVKENGYTWRMVEVKSSGSVKDYHRDDAAIQAFAARRAGIALERIAIAHIDTSWEYPGGGDYCGLLVESDLTEEAFARSDEVDAWVVEAHHTAAENSVPDIRTGHQCTSPFECGFIDFCRGMEPVVEYPVRWLPKIQTKALKAFVAEHSDADMRDVDDGLLNEVQRRVKQATVTAEPFFDAEGAALDLLPYGPSALFLDFETVNPAVPLWAGTRPFEQIPFQFSLHRIGEDGCLTDYGFLDLSGQNPSRPFADALINACGESLPVFVFNATFEIGRIKDLAKRFPELAVQLLAIAGRIVDLQPIARTRYYHPDQHGSWSIKDVLPTIAPDLSYKDLDGVQEGGMAAAAYRKAIHPDTPSVEKAGLERQLTAYCRLDTLAMVRVWQYFRAGGQA